MAKEYNIEYISALLHEKKPELWDSLGWMLSDLNNMPEEEDKRKMTMLGTEAVVFIRENNLDVSTRDEVPVVRQIAEISRVEQKLKRFS